MKGLFLSTILTIGGLLSANAQTATPDTIWVKFDNRFIANEYLSLEDIDSVEFTKTAIKRWKKPASPDKQPMGLSKTYRKDGEYHLGAIERYLAKPDEYSSCDYSKSTSQWCFERSMESEHFICFWEKGLTLSGGTVSGVNIKALLANAEKIWDIYVNQLGFLVPGNSRITDVTKIHMYIVNQPEWLANGSGQNGTEYYYDGTTLKSRARKVGNFHCDPQAAMGRGGHTPAHEIGHVFQYLVSADLGDSHGLNYGYGGDRWSGNCFWEDCANWQAYKVYPNMQFSDGEYYEYYMDTHHLNILHEKQKYNNCFYQDYWCMKHGMKTIGRIWRESTYLEDPVEAYMRLFGLDINGFADDMYECFARMASWDIDGVRDYAKHRIGSFPQRLIEPTVAFADKYLDGDRTWWTVSPDYCPQNFGFNINPLNVPAAGTVVKASFRGLAGADGFRSVNIDKAGWRYGLVAYTKDGQRIYGEMQSAKNDGVAEITVPDNCTNLWFIVMGAPTSYWQHKWDDVETNDEQWPYAVKFSGATPLGAMRTYDDFPDDYIRRDTTVVINASLTYSGSNYSATYVQYDTNAISEALGLSTAKLKTLKCNDTTANIGDIRFAGVNANGTTMKFNTTTSTSSSTVYGHWFTTAGNVSNYDSSAAVYAELTPANYKCKVGQFPGHLTKGKTYTIRQAVVYTHTDGKDYKAIIEVHLTIN